MRSVAEIFLLSTILVILQIRTPVTSFNIENRDAVVKKSKAGSYFGFSVAQHVEKDAASGGDEYWILVGAPLGKNLQPGTNQSGALFKCPISKNTNDCIQIETDGKRLDFFDYGEASERAPVTLLKPGRDEIKEDQWLGVTVRSQKVGGKVVVCAHRYIQSSDIVHHHYGMGLCYLLTNNLEAEEEIQPCKSQPVEKLHQQYGFCQVGTSLAVLEDGFAILGSPGPFTWRGTIFAKHVVGEYLDKDKTNYRGPLNDNPEPIDKYSYLGMSASGGYFFNKTSMTYVAGAPRANFTGRVFFFEKTKGVQEMGIRLIINGTQFASSFGYEILAVDIDQDGYDELLVGAPFYYRKDSGGAVYIYDNIRFCTNFTCQPKEILTGKPESRFGFAITSLGDINKDGYTDVAIGAPYEHKGGAVYIYLGTKNGLSKEPSQVLRVSGVETLGYSLSGGVDMDQNDYPDLLVGAYEKDLAILYLTRPIIDIKISMKGGEYKNINASKKGCELDRTTNKTCFSFTTCFTISNFRFSESLEIRYEIKEVLKKISRVTNVSKKPFYIKVDDISKSYCQTETVYLVEGNGDILTPIKFLVNYTLHDHNSTSQNQNSSPYKVKSPSPILNKTSIKEFEATFQKNCGDDDICNSHLVLNAGTQLKYTDEGYVLNVGENKEFVLDANITNQGESAYEAKLFVEYPEDLSYVALLEKNKTSNIICTSVNQTTTKQANATVVCNLGNPFQENQTVILHLRFEVKEPKRQKIEIKVYVNSTSHETSNQTSQSFAAILQKIAVFRIEGKGKPPNIFYAGKIRGQSDMKYLEDIGPKVLHTYTIFNHGQWNMRDVQVEILWPYQVYTTRKEGGKWLLYLEDKPSIDRDNTNACYVSSRKDVNPLELTPLGLDEIDFEAVNETSTNTNFVHGSRRKRDIEQIVASELKTGPDGKQRKVVTMDCLKKTAKCLRILCLIPQLIPHSTVKIEISARVWNSTLVEDYSQVDWVSIRSVGRILIENTTEILSEDSVAQTGIETVAFPSVVLADTSLNIWIIVGSVIAGLLLLIILIFILYKCGFFKRNRIKDHTLSGNLKKQGENENLLKENEGKPAK